MKVEVCIDERCTEQKVVIYTDRMTPEITELVNRLSENGTATRDTLPVFDENGALFIACDDISRVYSMSGKVFAQTDSGVYTIRARLYEVEEKLDKRRFARISNSEIINLRRVRRMDTSLTGTICVIMRDGTHTYASRRYVAGIRKMLEL